MDPSTESKLRTDLHTAVRHAAQADADRAEAQADLRQSQAATLRAEAREARTYAEAVVITAALAEVRRLCNLTISASTRVAAADQARDTLAVIDRITAGQPLPGDDAWGSVWLHGNWERLTGHMPTSEREHAADAVARWSARLAKDDGEPERGEPDGLRWWRES